MLIDFLLLSIVVFANIYYVFFLRKEYKRISFLYSFSLITIFYTPSLYFFFGGEIYRFFADKSLVDFFHYATIVFVFYIVIYILIDNIKTRKSSLYLKNSMLIKIYFLAFAIPIGLYYIIYFKQFPLIHFILHGELIDRPDLTGAIPHFYTVQIIVSIIIPSIYFYYFDTIKNKYSHIIINFILFFLFIASGNKGFIAYYLIFMWLYIFKARIDLKLFLIFIFLMFIYLLTKGITEINSEVLEYMINSPFRRFFVTQGTCFIHRVDMVNEGFDFLNNVNPRGLKFDVFAHMYNTTTIIGSAPTFYIGDFYAKYGEFFSLLVFIIISSIILLVSKFFYAMETNRKLFFYWNVYSLLFFIVMAEINFANMIRILVAVFNIIIIIFLSKLKLKKGNKCKIT